MRVSGFNYFPLFYSTGSLLLFLQWRQNRSPCIAATHLPPSDTNKPFSLPRYLPMSPRLLASYIPFSVTWGHSFLTWGLFSMIVVSTRTLKTTLRQNWTRCEVVHKSKTWCKRFVLQFKWYKIRERCAQTVIEPMLNWKIMKLSPTAGVK